MPLKTKVKAGNITNLSDARYCAGMGVDWLSFPINSVNPTLFKEITDWVTGPEFIVELTGSESAELIKQYAVTALQINLSHLNLADSIAGFDWIISLKLSDWNKVRDELLDRKEKISMLLVDFDITDQSELEEMAKHFLILANHTTDQSLAELIQKPIEGINISGDEELKPGLKDFDRMAIVLEELEEMD